MHYKVEILPGAFRALKKINTEYFIRIRNAIFGLGENPRPQGCKKLTGRKAWRIRIGNFRVIDEIQDKTLIVTVITIGDRKDIYR
jgi:mRNA interferase RelE/StbE